MLVAADNNFCPRRTGTGKELVIVRIRAYRDLKRRRVNDLRMDRHKLNKSVKIDIRVLSDEDTADTLIFRQYLRAHNKRYTPVTPGLQYPQRRSAKKNPRNKHIGIDNNFHRRPRAFAMAAAISDFFMPERRACVRAR